MARLYLLTPRILYSEAYMQARAYTRAFFSTSRDRWPVLRIRIYRIHMFLSLLDPDPLIRGMDPVRIRILLSPSKNNKVPSKNNKQKNFVFKFVFCWHLEGQ
jgi:hypothetical protein